MHHRAGIVSLSSESQRVNLRTCSHQKSLLSCRIDRQRIVALVAGNDNYRHYPPLKNGVKDARAFGAKLEAKGAKVIYALNCTASKFKAIVNQYVTLLRENDVGMFYFAGHGCEYQNAIRTFAISEGEKSDIKKDCLNVLVLINRLSLQWHVDVCSY